MNTKLMNVSIDTDACTGCGVCVAMCPQRILSLDPDTGKCRVKDDHRCDRLAGCERACPADAIHIRR